MNTGTARYHTCIIVRELVSFFHLFSAKGRFTAVIMLLERLSEKVRIVVLNEAKWNDDSSQRGIAYFFSLWTSPYRHLFCVVRVLVDGRQYIACSALLVTPLCGVT